MFKYRVITTCILIPTTVYFIFFLSITKFFIVNFLIYLFSSWEWSRLSGLISKKKRIICTIFFCIFPIISLLIEKNNIFLYSTKDQSNFILKISLLWWTCSIFFIFFYSKYDFFWKKSILMRIFFGILTIFPCFYGILLIRSFCYDSNQFFGSWILLYIMSTVWCIDSGAYIFGKIFGKKKILPNISPNKTIEGVIGGIILSIIPTLLFNKFLFFNIKKLVLVIYWILMIICSIIGDFSESMFKRTINIKDTSTFIPGHGGILDRIDSLTATIPILSYLMLQL